MTECLGLRTPAQKTPILKTFKGLLQHKTNSIRKYIIRKTNPAKI